MSPSMHPSPMPYLAAQVAGAEYGVDLAGLEQLLELLGQVAGPVRDVQVADAQDKHCGRERSGRGDVPSYQLGPSTLPV